MKETERLAKLFKDLYNGKPWIDMTLFGTLKKISAKQAAKKISPKWNSIWEITNHIISWRMHILLRLQGNKIKVKKNNYFTPVIDTSDAAWKDTLKRLEDSQQQWISFLKSFNEKDLETINPVSKLTWYEHIHSIIQHDVYHLGQIVMLTKAV